ncbi:MAG: AMP-binding protein [Alphaproteobacteria bacterium]|nr:AMP-binding protein [Alphaproteobacteria bacterium]
MLFDHELAWKDPDVYNEVYRTSIEFSEQFWEYHRARLFAESNYNASFNCVDRHAAKNPNKTALVWYGDEFCERREITYIKLLIMVQKIASELLRRGVRKGDSVTICMPMIPESIAAMLACCRIGAIHNVVFSGFSPVALRERVFRSASRMVLTVTSSSRGGKLIPSLKNVLTAIDGLNAEILLLDHVDDFSIDERAVHPTPMDYADSMFTLYTSGSTKEPKRIFHTCGGYQLYSAMTFQYIFDAKESDTYFCTSDIGWITGHSYITYAPLFFGLKSVIFSGTPMYPTGGRYWDIIEREKVSIFYSAPSAIRCLASLGNDMLSNYDFSSLRALGCVGEPMNESAWEWFFNNIGQKRCPIMDTWWQTETGGIMLAPLHNISLQKPCFAAKPFFGVVPDIQNDELVILKKNWPGLSSNFARDDGQIYHTGDKAMRDEDGDFRVLGRIDDVVNISGHRLGTSEVESIVNSLGEIEESAAIGIPHRIKGQALCIFATTTSTLEPEQKESVAREISSRIRQDIGAIAKPDKIVFIPELPKTRSGKIKRNILKIIGEKKKIDYESGDLSSLVNLNCIKDIETAMQRAIKPMV